MTALDVADSGSRRAWLSSRPILVFLLLAVGIGTAGLMVVRLGPAAIVDTRVPSVVMKFSPSLAGLIVAWLVGGRAGVARLLRGLDPRRASPRWYVIALLLPTLLYSVALVAAHRGLPIVSVAQLGDFFRSFAPLFVVRLFMGGGLGEELGWRGVMLPELVRRHQVVLAALLVGLAHGLWHAPSGVANAVALTTLTVPWAVVFAWLYYAAGRSVLVCAVAHASGNAWGPVIASAFPDAATAFLTWVVLLSWLGAVPAGLWLYKRNSEVKDESL